MTPSETNKVRTDRVYLRIEPELKEKISAYCDRRGFTMTQLVTRFFKKMLEEEDKEHEAKQF